MRIITVITMVLFVSNGVYAMDQDDTVEDISFKDRRQFFEGKAAHGESTDAEPREISGSRKAIEAGTVAKRASKYGRTVRFCNPKTGSVIKAVQESSEDLSAISVLSANTIELEQNSFEGLPSIPDIPVGCVTWDCLPRKVKKRLLLASAILLAYGGYSVISQFFHYEQLD